MGLPALHCPQSGTEGLCDDVGDLSQTPGVSRPLPPVTAGLRSSNPWAGVSLVPPVKLAQPPPSQPAPPTSWGSSHASARFLGEVSAASRLISGVLCYQGDGPRAKLSPYPQAQAAGVLLLPA
ncbi:hypothetical protein KIL84_021197 [Mauremys mutica]|uniref:Uncharacterized protein n=1 Tax=Mauremys mutica TaxID=74926 RepID=A0A9D3XB68_9SAUR|nr:hypothetical protein KIL84_021197 [Mauremys mutica]